jgi:putative hemolysin
VRPHARVRCLYLEIVIVLVLTLVNGVLAMSELAVVSSRSARLKILAEQGSGGARIALRLAEHPGRFLSTVQIGITLVGVLSGAFSGATLGARLSAWLETQGVASGLADALGVGSVVVAITYLSLIVGELVPKQIALRDPERVASRIAPLMSGLAKVAAPLVWLLDASGKAVLALLGQRGAGDDKISDEEVKTIIAEAESAGVIETEEREMISGVMRFADRAASALMTPRRDVEIIDLNDDLDTIRRQVHETRRTRLPVQEGEADAIIGVVFVKDLVLALAERRDVNVQDFMTQAPIVTDNARALDVLKAIRASTVHMALVFDEYGHFEGIITSGDILGAITGAFQEEGEDEPACVQRADGSWLVAGWMPVDEFAEKTGVPVDRDAAYETVAGLVLNTLNRLPEVGEFFSRGGWRFEVVDLDGRRIDKVLVSRDG